MKTVIVALNSKFIHSSLAPWYLKAGCGDECGDIKVLDYTINDDIDKVFSAIYKAKADNVAFSCYIWNISIVLKLVENLKKVSPELNIILGGPEVSFNANELMASNSSIDCIISGEGEIAFKLLLKFYYRQNTDLRSIKGITFRKDGKIVSNKPSMLIGVLDSIQTPYSEEMLASLGNKIVYYESSRGCPFSCSYCISSTIEGIRYFSMERVKKDLIKLINSGVRQVKFVDRTFNCNRERAKEIFRFIIELAEKTLECNIETCIDGLSGPSPIANCLLPAPKAPNFHFEAAADLFDDEMIGILSGAPEGLIQFEVGVQTTNLNTLELVNRKTSLEKVFHYIKCIKDLGNIHLHLDLIAGLPGESYDSFKKSFDDVYNLRPNQLQLGFLKMLKGSRVRNEADIHQYLFREYPPYEILNNKYISFDELLVLKGIEELVERYFNSGRFLNSLEFIIGKFFVSPIKFYSEFLFFYSQKGYLGSSLSSRYLYDALFEFVKTVVPVKEQAVINGLLKLDYLSTDNSNNLPSNIDRTVEKGFNELCFDFLKDENNISIYLPEYKNIPSKQIHKRVHFEIFNFDIIHAIKDGSFKEDRTVLMFNYDKRSRVTGLYEYQKVGI